MRLAVPDFLQVLEWKRFALMTAAVLFGLLLPQGELESVTFLRLYFYLTRIKWLGYWCRPIVGATSSQRTTFEREFGWAATARILQHNSGDVIMFAIAPAALCLFEQAHVFYMGFVGAVAHATSLDECGDICAATPECEVANCISWLSAGTCSMNGWGFPVAAWGVSWNCDAAFATGSQIPPILAHPPAQCLVETHGPYIGIFPLVYLYVCCPTSVRWQRLARN
jgi:hypothetical protein